MQWWIWLIIAVAIVLVAFLLVYFYGSARLKRLAYELVCNAEKILGSGTGKEKYDLVLKRLSALTHNKVSEKTLNKIIEWAVNKMKLMLLESSTSVKKEIDKGE